MSSRTRRPGPSERVRVHELKGATRSQHEDRVVTEEPLEIRVREPGTAARRLSVTMRTPGHDFELVAGWLRHEGLIADSSDLATVAYCTDVDLSEERQFNVVTADLRSPLRRVPAERYGGITAGSSACGVCGTQSLAEVEALVSGIRSGAELRDSGAVSAELLRSLPERMRSGQRLFDTTGGLHATALFDAGGEPRGLREDVGRHNAFDKATGAQLLAGEPLGGLACVSGRLGFELVQKAVASERTALVGVGAPTGLAVRLAQSAGLILAGFARADRMVIYAGAERLG